MSSSRSPFITSDNSVRRPLLRVSGGGDDDDQLYDTSYTSSDTMYTADNHLNSYSSSTATVANNLNNNKSNSIDTHIIVEVDQQPPPLQSDTSDGEEDQRTIVAGSQFNSTGSSLGPRIEKIDSGSTRITVKLASALFYGITSFLITVINKIILTSYAFPSSNVLGVGQMLAIILILGVARQFKYIKIRRVSIQNYRIWTLATIYLGNLVTGLSGTKHLPLPMFIALRRFSIAMTAVGEFFLLNVVQSPAIILTIVAMIGGSLVAACTDLSFNALGYLFVMVNNIFTAANVVYIKKTVDSKEVNKYELLYYNALITVIPLTLISYFTNNMDTLYNYPHWGEFGFIACFLLSCIMGFLLMFSTVLCTHYNSALTTTIVGTLKNILTTYIGMFIGGDYVFGVLNFLGLNISLVGSLAYTYIVFSRKSLPTVQVPNR